jgi:hypothetical protein
MSNGTGGWWGRQLRDLTILRASCLQSPRGFTRLQNSPEAPAGCRKPAIGDQERIMRARRAIIVGVAWLMASAVFSPRASHAGFLPTDVSSQYLLEDAGTSSPGPDRASDPAPERNSVPYLLSSPASPWLGDGGGSTSSTGTVLRLSSGGVYASLPSQVKATTLPAAERLLVEESTLIPAECLSRVFRPPRG